MQYNYSEKVVQHFMNPRNIGEIPDADGIGTIGSEECGDMIKIWIKVADEHLVDIKYKVFGCPAAIASCSMMTELATGQHADEAWNLTDDQVAEALGGLPADKYHCSNLAASALHKAIMNYALKGPVRKNTVTITILVDNTASKELQSEHGLSLWIEYADKRILFDAGQSDLLVRNAQQLGADLAETNAVVLSHGHYDHTGGLDAVLNIAPDADIYLHPATLKSKYGRKNTQLKTIGMSDSTKDIIRDRDRNGKVVWTENPTEVFPGLLVTGQIPRKTNFEDVGGNFFVDVNCKKPDTMPDDQALAFDSPKGLIIILGCAHAGAVNTLHYVAKLSGGKHIYAVIGGMHLLNASAKRVECTINVFRQYDVQKIGLAHCTGGKAIEKFKSVFPSRCFVCSVGTQILL